eukprot:CAMPEP_0172673564 /NCGR_PEP_ID=MMETSP1074-20121228/12219_1 /TAXON_ID=2916 /ORGANISM="Ceratium fusus, Strain PA161109" /LENGTH=380 /DNA_ID=CAMNT_0013490879 /DNA_START=63 /DNA_END=1205 /DNA_ORIENTATION=-
MATVIQVLLLSLLVGPVLAARMEAADSESAESNEWMHSQGGGCSNLVTLGGQPVSCTVVDRLQGGMQANTYVVNINGKTYVMKETHDASTIDNLRKEKNIIKKLQKSSALTHGKIPDYDLDFQAKQPESEVLVMEFLKGWFDLSKQRYVNDPEVRAAAFFVALDGIFKAGVSHCDLNLGNAMFHPSDPTRCKIIDFGMAEVSHSPGTCLAMNANPDLGRQGQAWETIYKALGAPKSAGSIYSVCGKCDTQMNWNSIVRQSQATINSFDPRRLQESKPVVNQQLQDFKPVVNQPVVKRPEKKPKGLQGDGMVLVNELGLAQQIKNGTPIKVDGVMGKAAGFPKINGQALIFDFHADDGSKQFNLRVYWSSNRGKLMALISS